ncbi:MAG: histidine--tRNA ligase [Candidatus Electrothrix sp. AX2]|nr:histidine--tRNA ligase [Candidatus Electrothrix gigas]
MQSNKVKPERPGGFIDFLPADYLARKKMLETIEGVFFSFGFDPIETPIIEFTKILSGETSETGKNIFHVTGSEADESLSLRFDQTVPFARLLASNPYNAKKRKGIRLPWRRMAVGPVFRKETPQSGRYRQFYQFDADIAGTTSMMADAEILAMMYRTFEALGISKFVIRLNNRKILNGLTDLVGIKERETVSKNDITQEMMRILDKLDKIGLDGVEALLQETPVNDFDPKPNLSPEDVQKISRFLAIQGGNTEKIAQCKELFNDIQQAAEGLAELEEILSCLEAMNIPEEYVSVDFSIARGLDYYTGPVMETSLSDAPEFGSVFSGGRYNDLVSRFTGNELPAVGASVGVDRLFAALDHLDLIDREKSTVTDVLVLRLEAGQDKAYIEMADQLRRAGKNAEVSMLDDVTFKGQFNYAISRNPHYMIICGEDEFKKNTVQVKNLRTREQVEVDQPELVNYFK